MPPYSQSKTRVATHASAAPVLRGTQFKRLGEKKVGKVRDSYIQKDKIILIATDRHSSFDRLIAYIPHKGQIVTQLSLFWFERTRDIMPNHVLVSPDPNVIIGKRCRVVPLEIIARGYITGVTSTSLWTRYRAGERDFGFFTLPEGLQKNQKLPQPVLTPTTKFEEHDRNLLPTDVEALIGRQLWEKIEKTARELFARGQAIAAEQGLILVDTKYEFGLDENNELILIDEIHTPDSSRWWKVDSYNERLSRGEEPEYFDKEFLRLWFMAHSDPYHDKTLPEAPADMVAELSRRYIQIYEQLIGETFIALTEPPSQRIRRNLKAYHT